MLTISSTRPVLRRRSPSSSNLYRPRTIILDKPSNGSSFGFSIQTYGFTSTIPLGNDESASSLLSLSSESTTSRKSSSSNSFYSPVASPPIHLVTYIDHVHEQSHAWEAGLRPGSVILSVNNESVEHDHHESLVKRITDASSNQIKLIVIQQNVNKQIALCEQLQRLQKQLHEKEEEFAELCRQERLSEDEKLVQETTSPSPRLLHGSDTKPERTSSFCRDKIPLDWRQSVANFAHQQQFFARTFPPICFSSTSISSSKYTKNRPQYQPYQQQHHQQRSMSLSTLVLHYSKSSLLRRHPLGTIPNTKQRRRAFSFEDLFSSNRSKEGLSPATTTTTIRHEESMIASGCSLAMDISALERNHCSSSSSSSEDENDEQQSKPKKDDHLNNKVNPFKWKLKISK